MIIEEIRNEKKIDTTQQEWRPRSHIKMLKVLKNLVTIFNVLIDILF